MDTECLSHPRYAIGFGEARRRQAAKFTRPGGALGPRVSPQIDAEQRRFLNGHSTVPFSIASAVAIENGTVGIKG